VNPVRLSLVLVVASAMGATAQTPEITEPAISADRPDVATPPRVLRPGLIQFEGGVTFSMDTGGDRQEHTLTFGSRLIRIGAGRSVELRVAGDGILSRSNDGVSRDTSGWSDLAVGAKLALVHEGRIVPAISLLPSVSVPAGYKAFTSSTYDPSMAVARLETLPAGLSLVGTLSGTSIFEVRIRHARYTSAIGMWFPAPARSTAYVEMYAVTCGGAGSASARIYDAGLTHNFGPKSPDRYRGGAPNVLRSALLVCRDGICVAARSIQTLTVPEQIHPEPNCAMPPLCGTPSTSPPGSGSHRAGDRACPEGRNETEVQYDQKR